MAEFAASNEKVFPTFNDVGVNPGDGKRWHELNVTEWIRAFNGADFISSGFLVPASSVDLNINIPTGVAYLKGYRVEIPGSTQVTAAASTTTYVFLKLKRDLDGFVEEVVFESSASPTAGADSMLLCALIASGTAITSTSDLASRTTRGADPNEALTFLNL